MTGNDQQTAEAVRMLDRLLRDADLPTTDGGPIMLTQQLVAASRIEAICTTKSNQWHATDSNDSTKGTMSADEFIAKKLADGFVIMAMSIIRTSAFSGSTEHVVLTVLVKLKDETETKH